MKKITTILIFCVSILIGINYSLQAQPVKQKKYVKVPTGYLMVLTEADSIFSHLEAFAIQEKVPSANFTAMGFVDITFGFFNSSTKEYEPREFKNVELASMQGSLAWQKGKPSIHAHGVVGGKDFQAFGGHVLSGIVGKGSLEVMITTHDKRLERKFNEQLGANILQTK